VHDDAVHDRDCKLRFRLMIANDDDNDDDIVYARKRHNDYNNFFL
jgi:hypothetical protein